MTRRRSGCRRSTTATPAAVRTEARARPHGRERDAPDAVPKTTGEFEYASDLGAAGMLWGHTARSPHAHARVIEVDIAPALAMPGVHAVLTHSDIPGQKTYGLEFPDQPVLAIDRVRFFGEPVAAGRCGASRAGASRGRCHPGRVRAAPDGH